MSFMRLGMLNSASKWLKITLLKLLKFSKPEKFSKK
jgi:hypothetical protein